jgi:hypothetical protein
LPFGKLTLETFELFSHYSIWSAIDKLARENDVSASGLARNAGLDPTTFNKSKRITKNGKKRWPSTESISKILAVTKTPLLEFAVLVDEENNFSFEEVLEVPVSTQVDNVTEEHKRIDMTPADLIRLFSDVRSWQNGKKKALNKPLLVLFALGKLKSQGIRRLSFADCEGEYGELLRQYGNTGNQTPSPSHAFYRLKNDKNGAIWSISDPNKVLKENSSGDVRVSDLRDVSVELGFPSEVIETFNRNPELVCELAESILSAHFSPSDHLEILISVGLTVGESKVDKKLNALLSELDF